MNELQNTLTLYKLYIISIKLLNKKNEPIDI